MFLYFFVGVPGEYYSVALPKTGTNDLKILEISNILMPLYQKLGKFTETAESIAACAVDVVIMHVQTNFPVSGIDINRCPDWNHRDFSKLQNYMAIANHFLKPDGTLLCVCHASFHASICACASSEDFVEDHSLGILTRGIHGVINEMPVRFI